MQTTASDDNPVDGVEFDTVNMRNQAQTEQIEISGSGTFSFSLGFGAGLSDWDDDGMPNSYEDGIDFLSSSNAADGSLDQDGDGASNSDEYVGGTSSYDSDDFLRMTQMSSSTTGIVVRFPAKANREYLIHYDNVLVDGVGWSNATPTPITVAQDGDYIWTDDGTYTDPDPSVVTSRFYKVDVRLVE